MAGPRAMTVNIIRTIAKSSHRQYEYNFLGLIWSRISETMIFRPWVAFQFSHVNITMTDYAMAIFIKTKYPFLFIFICLDFVVYVFQ